MKSNESLEMYLETILILSYKGSVRSIDIANELCFSKPSVSIAVKKMQDDGYIVFDDNSKLITLTPEGLKIAETIYERHLILSEFFENLGVDKNIARNDACRIEHVISKESFSKIKQIVENKKSLS